MRLQYFILSIMTMLIAATAIAGPGASKSAVMLDIIDGDTAFVLDAKQSKAWWVVGACRRPIPLVKAGKSQKTSINSMRSEIISEQVRIGDRQVTLRQQFRFTLATTPTGQYSAEVYNSLRGGWAPVPVRLNANCALDSSCRRRMESPEC